MAINYSGGITVISGGFNNRSNEPPQWSTASGSLGNATGGAPFNFNLSASDPENEPVSFVVASGSLPTGLTMNSAGQISGTAVNNPGTYNFTVIVSDSSIGIKRDFSITVTNTTPVWATPGGALTIAHGGQAYSETLVANDANYDVVTYSLYSSTLPQGLTLNGTSGVISGTPTNTPTTVNFTVRADDGHGATADRAFSIQVTNDSPVWQSPATTLPGPYIQDVTIGTISLVATDSNGDLVTYAYQSGTIPAGITLSGATLVGTPTTPGAYSFTIRASDPNGAYADRTFSMTIGALVAWVSPAENTNFLEDSRRYVNETFVVTPSPGNTITSYTLSGSVPQGLVAYPTGALTGRDLLAPDANAPAWTTSQGSLGSVNEAGSFSTSLVAAATPGRSISRYAIINGYLPWGIHLTGSNGTLLGTAAEIFPSTDAAEAAIASPPTWNTSAGSLATVNEGKTVSVSLSATAIGGRSMARYGVVSGYLPHGIRLNASTGAITGTAAEIYPSTGEVEYHDASTEPTITTASTSLGSYARGATISNFTISATYVSPATAKTFVVSSGTLPEGLRLAGGTGVIQGTVSTNATVGVITFGVKAVDSDYNTSPQVTYTITIT